jgi:hypothetical protein
MAIAGWSTVIRDADSGEQILTVSEITVYIAADAIMWAELTMWCDAEGKPLASGQPVLDDGEILTATFPYLVSGMRQGETAAA